MTTISPTPGDDGPGVAPAVRVRALRKSYGPREVVAGLDLTAPRGHVTAVLGPNGAGKTTTIECCEGLRMPDAGSIEVLGLSRWDESSGPARGEVAARLRSRVGVMLQDGGLPKAPAARAVLAHVAALHEDPLPVDDLLERLHLTEVARTSVRRLSGGQAQRLALACAIVGRPDLVFLDEPSAGLDPQARRRVWSLLEELRAGGTSMVLTTHLMDEAEHLADLVHVLHRGRVVAQGPPAELTGPPRLQIELPAGSFPEEATRVVRVLGEALPHATVGVSAADRRGAPPSVHVTLPGASTPRLTAVQAAKVGRSLTQAGFGDAVLDVHHRTLEDVFLDLTGTTLAPREAA